MSGVVKHHVRFISDYKLFAAMLMTRTRGVNVLFTPKKGTRYVNIVCGFVLHRENLIGDLPIRFFECGSSSFLAIHPLTHLVDAITEDDGVHCMDEWGILSVLLQDRLDDVVLFDYGFKLGLSVP